MRSSLHLGTVMNLWAATPAGIVGVYARSCARLFNLPRTQEKSQSG